ncbi:MAG TPA: lipid A deacylase LpxR family protein [Usitatibacter sp.]|nr:lipid A deacylase LpxR family protein [Usitatibacter sp.]
MRRALAAAAACAASGACAAPPGWYLQVDNDVVFGTDRWYTSGVRIAHVEARGGHELEWGLLQEIYTPEAKRDNAIDRPNAARLLATLARHDRAPGDWRTLEADLGVTGPAALGRQAQEFVHRFVPAPHEDWSHQRPNRVDAQLAWARTQRLPLEPLVNANYGAVIGNQLAFAHAGIELRFGRGAATGLETPALRFAATPPLADAQAPSWSPFVGASVRAVAWNRLLDVGPGDPRQTPDLRHVVGRFSGGIAWTGHGAQVVFALLHDTAEFAGQRRGADFGSLTLHLTF